MGSHHATGYFSIIFCLGVALVLGLFLPDRIVKPFRSIRFNVGLFIVISVLSALGTFIPQNKSLEMMMRKLGPFWGSSFNAMGFFNLYHTWWFGFFLGLMAFDVVVCKLRRFPRQIYFGSPNEVNTATPYLQNVLAHSQWKESWTVGQTSSVAVEQCAEYFLKRGIKLKKITLNDGWALRGGKQKWQRWGDFILHISIVLILVGGLWGAQFGFEEPLTIPEGQSVMMKNRPFEVVLHQFDIEYYHSTGAPSLYASDLELRHNGITVANKRVIVNDPLDLNGVRFYQASWGMTDQFHSVVLHMAGQNIQLPSQKIMRLGQTPLSVRAVKFLPTFDIDSERRAITLNYQGANPAVLIEFLKDQTVQAQVWLLRNSPQLAFRVKDGQLFPTESPPFSLVDVQPVLFSGIQVSYDPGAPLFWFGAVVLLVGLALHFYSHQRRVAMVITQQGNSCHITIGGWNSRRPHDMKTEFDEWVAALKLRLQ